MPLGRFMPYQATVFRVMIASPADCSEEFAAAQEVISRWNAAHSASGGIHLETVSWMTHARPATGLSAQSIINDQVLRDADILVATFWTRLGTPTETAPSGTAEEINEHAGRGKPVLVYKCGKEIDPNRIDSAEHERLKLFLSKLQESALTGQYSSTEDFKAQFSTHLAKTVNSDLLPQIRTRSSHDGRLAVVEPEISLSDEGKQLLLEASRDPHGSIIHVKTFGAEHIQTNGRQMISQQDARTVARWVAALEELSRLRLIKDESFKGEVFRITDLGYKTAEKLVETPV